MGDKEDNAKRKILENYQVTNELINLAKDESIFLHCLPAHRGEEVTEEVIDGDKSFVWDEAENRVHAQKGIIDWCFS
jgi:ornithine carbamoyltransferase